MIDELPKAMGLQSIAWDVWSRTQIQKRLAQHARGIDRADEALLREAYHADGTVDYGSLQGTAGEFASAIAAMLCTTLQCA